MTPEELKLILETIKTISGDASTAAVVWVSLHYGVDVLRMLIACITLFSVIYVAVRFFVGMNEWAALGRSVAKAYKAEGGAYVYPSDEKAIAKAIQKAGESQLTENATREAAQQRVDAMAEIRGAK